MTTAWRLLAFTLISVAVVLPILSGGDRVGSTRCEKDSVSRQCRIHLALSDLSTSERPDGSLALAASLINDGRLTAKTVKVSSIEVEGGGLIAPASFPLPLGDLPSNAQSVLQARLGRLATVGAATVTLKGTYRDWAETKHFTLRAPLATDGNAVAPIPIKWIK